MGESIPNNLGHIKPYMPNTIIKPGNLGGFPEDDEGSFSKVLENSIQSVNKLQKNAGEQVEKLAKGEIKDVDQVMVALQEAGVTFKLMMKVRDQLMKAYTEITKGQ